MSGSLKIITLVDKNEDFIELQYNSIEKYIDCDVEYIVFNNATTPENREKITNICIKLKTRMINMPSCVVENFYGESEPSNIVGMSLLTMWDDYLKNMDGSIIYMDSDMFFINKLDIKKLNKKYDVAYVPQYRDNYQIKYMWTGFFFLNMETIEKDINFGYRDNVRDRTDIGGNTSYFLENRNYRELLFNFYTIEDISDNIVYTSVNGNTKKNIDIFDEDILNYEEHFDLINRYDFPTPYLFDLFRIKGENKSFLFHYKSANWNPVYEDGNNFYSINKKNALRKMLNG